MYYQSIKIKLPQLRTLIQPEENFFTELAWLAQMGDRVMIEPEFFEKIDGKFLDCKLPLETEIKKTNFLSTTDITDNEEKNNIILFSTLQYFLVAQYLSQFLLDSENKKKLTCRGKFCSMPQLMMQLR